MQANRLGATTKKKGHRHYVKTVVPWIGVKRNTESPWKYSKLNFGDVARIASVRTAITTREREKKWCHEKNGHQEKKIEEEWKKKTIRNLTVKKKIHGPLKERMRDAPKTSKGWKNMQIIVIIDGLFNENAKVRRNTKKKEKKNTVDTGDNIGFRFLIYTRLISNRFSLFLLCGGRKTGAKTLRCYLSQRRWKSLSRFQPYNSAHCGTTVRDIGLALLNHKDFWLNRFQFLFHFRFIIWSVGQRCQCSITFDI